MNLNAVIIDDEPKSVATLKTLLEVHCPTVSIVGTAGSPEEAKILITNKKPQLVFLDVEMPTGDGFSILNEFESPEFEVIFITAHEHYALRAFRTAAVDYLLKPVDVEQLIEAVRRVQEKVSKSQGVNQSIEVLLSNLNAPKQTKKIALASSEGLMFIAVTDIIYCRGDGAYTYFFIKNGKRITVSKNLKEYEELLPSDNFFRVHKSFLINMDEMQKYIRGEGGQVVMSNGDYVDVSKRRKENFLGRLERV